MPRTISSITKDNKNTAESIKEITEKLAYQLPKTIRHYFPKLVGQLHEMPECRKRVEYKLSEIIMGAITLHLFKEGSRNAYNNERKDEDFKRNYKKLFGMKLPHMDSVDDVFRVMDSEEMEKLKVKMVRSLLAKKVFHKWRFKGKYFVVAIDGTGVMSFTEKHCDKCLTRESKTGVKLWFHNVLEAKLLLPNSIAISLASEWIENNKDGYNKQDCELKAFKRLAKKLKKYYPRLPICIVGDGLYPNKPVFSICKANKWEQIITLKDGNLRTVWEEVNLLKPLQKGNRLQINSRDKSQEKTNNYRWINEIDYCGYKLEWIEMKETIRSVDKTESKETTKRYVYVSSFKINEKTAAEIILAGRLRWKIENEGFNDQKNRGYELGHKYSQVSLRAAKNYYESIQIAATINQLLVLGEKLRKYIRKKITIKYLWKRMISFLQYGKIDENKLEKIMSRRIQVRLE